MKIIIACVRGSRVQTFERHRAATCVKYIGVCGTDEHSIKKNH